MNVLCSFKDDIRYLLLVMHMRIIQILFFIYWNILFTGYYFLNKSAIDKEGQK